MRQIPRPDFFIVGAPKSGTTALHEYLRAHPDIYMPTAKELHFFGRDLAFRRTPRLTESEYLRYFRAAGRGTRVGEASVRYLRSAAAAGEIAAFAPDAQIIIMLRDPVDMMHALHAELVALGVEDILDFEQALEAEADRRLGLRIPPPANVVEDLFYRDMATYAPQVKRYLDQFGQDRVHVIIFDDFRSDTPVAYRRVLEFLGVDDRFAPEFRVVNAGKRARSSFARDLLAAPPPVVRALVRLLLPRAERKRLWGVLQRLNSARSKRGQLSDDLVERLRLAISPDVRALELLLGRSLPAWRSIPQAPSYRVHARVAGGGSRPE